MCGGMQEYMDAARGKEGVAPPPANPMLLGLSPAEYVLRALEKIRAADLEQALLLLPFHYGLQLLEYLCHWLEKGVKVGLAPANFLENSKLHMALPLLRT